MFSSFCQHSLLFVGFFSISFGIGDVSNKFVRVCCHVINLKMKMKLIALASYLKHAA